MHGIVEVTSSYSEYFRSRAHVGGKLLTISQPTPWDNQPRSPLHGNGCKANEEAQRSSYTRIITRKTGGFIELRGNKIFTESGIKYQTIRGEKLEKERGRSRKEIARGESRGGGRGRNERKGMQGMRARWRIPRTRKAQDKLEDVLRGANETGDAERGRQREVDVTGWKKGGGEEEDREKAAARPCGLDTMGHAQCAAGIRDDTYGQGDRVVYGWRV